MSLEQFGNLAASLSTSSLNNTDNPVTINLTVGDGALFPATTNGPFRVTVSNTDRTNAEIMIVTTRASDVLTAYRGANIATYSTPEPSTPALTTHTANSVVCHAMTVGAMREWMYEAKYGEAPDLTQLTTATFTTAITDATLINASFTNISEGPEPGVQLAAQGTSADTAIMARMITLPAAPYHMRARYRLTACIEQYPMAGLCLSDGTKVCVFGNMSRNDTGRIRATCFTNSSVFSGAYDVETAWWAGWPGRDGLFDIQIIDDGTNRVHSVIADGTRANAVSYFSQGNTSFITPTYGGIFIAPGHNVNGDRPMYMKCVSFALATGT